MDYLKGFDEIHKLMPFTMSASKKEVEDYIEDLLIDAYVSGAEDVSNDIKVPFSIAPEDLLASLPYDKSEVERVLNEYRASGEKDLAERLIASEYHRAYNEGSMDMATALGAKSKKWVTKSDVKVRMTHDLLEGVKIPLSESFNTIDGDSAKYPGGFSLAENNANCRCVLKYFLT